jgi:hypothetical protein
LYFNQIIFQQQEKPEGKFERKVNDKKINFNFFMYLKENQLKLIIKLQYDLEFLLSEDLKTIPSYFSLIYHCYSLSNQELFIKK